MRASECGYNVQIRLIYIIHSTCFIFSYAVYLFIMGDTVKHDAHSEVVCRISHEDSQPTESDINQDISLYTASSTFPVPVNNTSHCSDEYKIARNVKCAHTPPENMHEYNADIQKNHNVDDDIGYGLQSVKYEEQPQDFNELQAVIPSMNADQAPMLSCDANKIPEVKADHDEYSRNSDATRHWVVCQGGVLKLVKAEYTLGVSLLPAEEGNVNVDKKQLDCSKVMPNWNMEVN